MTSICTFCVIDDQENRGQRCRTGIPYFILHHDQCLSLWLEKGGCTDYGPVKFFTNYSMSSILAPGTKVTQLKNGIRVASHSSQGHFVSAGSSSSLIQGVFLDAGSRLETLDTQGCAHFMDRMTFKVLL